MGNVKLALASSGLRWLTPSFIRNRLHAKSTAPPSRGHRTWCHMRPPPGTLFCRVGCRFQDMKFRKALLLLACVHEWFTTEATQDIYPKSCTFGYCVERILESLGEMDVIISPGRVENGREILTEAEFSGSFGVAEREQDTESGSQSLQRSYQLSRSLEADIS